jgi:redox-sensing transcriptional repressor
LNEDSGHKRSGIPNLTTRRLSIYLHCMQILEVAGVETISSRDMAEQFHLNSAQFRKDLAYFGEFGVRGLGYRVPELRQHLIRILGLDRRIRMAIMGAGNLGTALAGYGGFNTDSLKVVALFDADPNKVGKAIRPGLRIYHVSELIPFIQGNPVEIAVLAVPARVAQEVLAQVAAAGIKSVLNFVPARLKVPEGVRVKSVDLKVQVESLVFHLPRPDQPEEAPADKKNTAAVDETA